MIPPVLLRQLPEIMRKAGGNHGTIYDAQYHSDSSNVETYILTDPSGDYSLRNIYYDGSREFKIKPSKGDHGFNPDSRNATLDINTPTINAISFTDTTTFTVSGKIQYAGVSCNLEGADIFLDGFPTGVKTNALGEFSISVDEPGQHTITPSFSNSLSAHYLSTGGYHRTNRR